MAKILFVLTGADYWTLADGSKHPTGFWAEEVVAPHRIFTAAGHQVVVATPGGVIPTVDFASLAPGVNGGQQAADAVAADLAAIRELHQPIAVADVDLADFSAVFYPGGHGPMEDLSRDADSARLLVGALAAGTPLGVVCHGPAALLATGAGAATGAAASPFAGYRVTAFTNTEEAQAGFADRARWLLQDRLTALGVDFQEGEPWTPHVVVDRNLYTGQNPASAGPVAAEMLTAPALA